MKTYTICLTGLEERETIVIGGGRVAAQKVMGLLGVDAKITVISPKLNPELKVLADTKRISHNNRIYQEGDLEGAAIVYAATNDPVVNQAIWTEATKLGCLINVVDDPEHSSFIMPAILNRGDLQISISTGGSSPALARRLREKLETVIGPEYGILTAILAEIRSELLTEFSSGKMRLKAAYRVVDSNILDIIRTQGKDAALNYAREQLHSTSEPIP